MESISVIHRGRERKSCAARQREGDRLAGLSHREVDSSVTQRDLERILAPLEKLSSIPCRLILALSAAAILAAAPSSAQDSATATPRPPQGVRYVYLIRHGDYVRDDRLDDLTAGLN